MTNLNKTPLTTSQKIECAIKVLEKTAENSYRDIKTLLPIINLMVSLAYKSTQIRQVDNPI